MCVAHALHIGPLAMSPRIIVLSALLATACGETQPTTATISDNIDDSSAECEQVPQAQRTAAQIAMYQALKQGSAQGCFDTSGCPVCGSYCSDTGYCQLDCVSDPTGHPELACGEGKTCDSFGKCVNAPPPPPTPAVVDLAFGNPSVAGNTATSSVVVPIDLVVTAFDLRSLDVANAAQVTLSFVEVAAYEQHHPGETLAPAPQVRCSAAEDLAEQCTLAGGWGFDLMSGRIQAKKTVWVEIPQTAVEQHWTLQARSDRSVSIGNASVHAAPLVIPATDPGRYTGTMIDENPGSGAALQIPITAVVTPSTIVVSEPSAAYLADGQTVLSRDSSKSTLMDWLAGSTRTYQVALHLDPTTYTATTAHLDATVELALGNGQTKLLALSLDRTGDAQACPCAAGTHCNAASHLCVAGDGADPTSSTVVAANSASPTTDVPSTLLASWNDALATASATVQLQTGWTGVERAYCYDSNLVGPARFAVTTDLEAVSGDRQCQSSGRSPQTFVQPTFGFENIAQEVGPTVGGGTYDLYQACTADLAASASGNILGDHTCASIGRFLLALRANASTPLPDFGQRLVLQILRQWLGANAYFATTSVEEQAYDAVLASDPTPPNLRLGSALDQVNSNLLVMLDPTVRAQWASGADLTKVLVQPDYRVTPRPVVRWSFNDRTSPSADGEGSNAFLTSGPGLDLSTGMLVSTSNAGVQTCSSSDVVALGNQFSIVANLAFVPLPGTSMVLIDKLASDHVRLIGTATSDPTKIQLSLSDTHGGVVTFPPIHPGMFGIVANNSSYTLYQTAIGVRATPIAPTSVVGAPHWGSPAPVQLACNPPHDENSCWSYDQNAVGDFLGTTYLPTMTEHTASQTYVCSTNNSTGKKSCTGAPPESAACTNGAATKQASLRQALSLYTPAPTSLVNGLRVTGTLVVTDEGDDDLPRIHRDWVTYHCDFVESGLVQPTNGKKPVCGLIDETIGWDEVSLWDRAIQPEEFSALVDSYGGLATKESLPPHSTAPVGDQATGLPVQLLEAASADLDLLSAYIEAERSVMYDECYAGGHSDARDRVAKRGGRNLRLVEVLEAEANRLVGLPGVSAAAWIHRFSSAQRELAGRRTKVFRALAEANECKNPLGISEQDIPLYVGEVVGDAPAEEFFSSSRFLAQQALQEINLAEGREDAAHNAYDQQRQQAYQRAENASSIAQRIASMTSDYDSQLLRFCGQPSGQKDLLSGFEDGTFTAGNCFVATERPECAAALTQSISDIPATCLRGELGSRVLAIQSANVSSKAATNAMARGIAQYDNDATYCEQRQEFLHQTEKILAKHYAHMDYLRESEALKNELTGWLGDAIHINTSGLMNDIAGISAAYGIGVGLPSFAENAEKEKETNDEEMQARSHELDIADCYHKVDNEKFAIDASADTMTRASQDVLTAFTSLASAQNQISGIVDQAAGQIATAQQLAVTPPHLHFWLDQTITEYNRHLAYAKRLTYLALRALEYESQQSIGLRTETLTAQSPDQLRTIVTAISAHSAPMQGTLGYTIDSRPIVLSLRDEILDVAAYSAQPLPGETSATPEEKFRALLRSKSSVIQDANHNVIGHGIRFSLKPDSWTELNCAERIVRLQPSVQLDNPPSQHQVVLYQDNAFGSQSCAGGAGDVTVTRAEGSSNLLAGDSTTFSAPSAFTPITLDGPPNLDPESLRALGQSNNAGLAGRGLYGNYLLLFPGQTWTDAELSSVKDVLLRFDITEATHSSL